MRSIAPRIEGADEFSIAEDQLEFMPVTACLVRFSDNSVSRVLRYTFTSEERAKIAAGEDIYFGTPASQLLQPHWFMVGWEF
jgi:hypothetical protein